MYWHDIPIEVSGEGEDISFSLHEARLYPLIRHQATALFEEDIQEQWGKIVEILKGRKTRTLHLILSEVMIRTLGGIDVLREKTKQMLRLSSILQEEGVGTGSNKLEDSPDRGSPGGG